LLLNYATYPGDILYTVPNITPGVNHTVRLYFTQTDITALSDSARWCGIWHCIGRSDF